MWQLECELRLCDEDGNEYGFEDLCAASTAQQSVSSTDTINVGRKRSMSHMERETSQCYFQQLEEIAKLEDKPASVRHTTPAIPRSSTAPVEVRNSTFAANGSLGATVRSPVSSRGFENKSTKTPVSYRPISDRIPSVSFNRSQPVAPEIKQPATLGRSVTSEYQNHCMPPARRQDTSLSSLAFLNSSVPERRQS